MQEHRGAGVAVIIAAMNASATIGRAIRSALGEPEVEQVIVIDDGSSDDTVEAAQVADDGSGRLLIERLPVNRGPSAARNRALAVAMAKYVAILDADDLIVAGRFARLLAIPEWDMIADDILFVADGTDLDRLVVPGSTSPLQTLNLASFIDGCIAQPNGVRSQLGFLKPVIRRSLLEGDGLRYDERVRLGEDFLLYLEMLRRGAHFVLAGSVGYIAVERSHSLSARHTTGDLEALLDAERAFARLLPAHSSEARGMMRRIAETDGKHALRAFLDVRQRAGIGNALAWLAQRPRLWRKVTAGVARDKLGVLRARFRPHPVTVPAPRRLLRPETPF
jgi:succinoglycan biosynthesis protein ExoU